MQQEQNESHEAVPITETGWVRWLRQPVVWAMVYGALIAYGLYALINIPVEVLPRFDFPQISIVTSLPGSSTQELEAEIARPIENELLALPQVTHIRSTIGHGQVATHVRFAEHSNPTLDLQMVNGAIDRARSQLPNAAHPFAEIMGNAINEIADYSLILPSDASPDSVRRLIDSTIVPQLRAVPGVQRVDVFGGGVQVLWVQPDLAAMQQRHLSVADITHALRQYVVLQPAGYVSLGHQDVQIELRALPRQAPAIRQITIPTRQGPIPLSAIARVVRAPMPSHSAVTLDNRTTIAMTVFKQPGASTLPVTREVQNALNLSQSMLPPGSRWLRVYDQGHLVGIIGNDLTRNLLLGAALAVLVLFWLLGGGRGVWLLAVSIPLSLLLAIAGLYAVGQTLNLLTLGALTVAVGLLADDAIIVLESIIHRWEQGDARWTGVWRGLRDIASPDISGTLSTVAVFLPLLLVGGLAGLFFLPFALAMTFALLASLVVSLTLIPLGLGLLQADRYLRRPAKAAPRKRSGARLIDALYRWNLKLFYGVLRYPRAGLSLSVGLLVLSVASMAWVTVNFLPLPNEGVMLESFTLPPGTSLTETRATVARITQRLREDPAVAHVFARIGSATSTAYTEPAYAGEIQIVLHRHTAVNDLNAIGGRLTALSALPGVQTSIDTPTIERVGESLSGLPQPFVIRLFGPHIDTLHQLADEITHQLRTAAPGLSDVFNNDGYPINQLNIVPRPDALALYGITPGQLDMQLQPLLSGQILATVPDGNLPLPLFIRLAGAPDWSLRQLAALPITVDGDPAKNAASQTVTLGQIASIQMIQTPNQIRHIQGARALDILATPTSIRAVADINNTLDQIKLPSGYRITVGGLYPELIHTGIVLAVAALIAFGLMLGILLLQFDGWLAPGLLLLQIPLALTGGALALSLSGIGLNVTGLIAFITLIGLSLNHGIVLLYRIHRNERHLPLRQAVEEAIAIRFRPILLTVLTAMLGMLPTALGWGQGAAPEQGLAVVILGGIFWSALLSTNLIPALYVHLCSPKGSSLQMTH
ncbi:efflux RND transporter permease subunit [Halothiobacillus sp.]|uniref:efflux RND transporter permease subunit n=1 Tax=Halothiobacillus sp. TaxID=1891311 RepID=UPI00263435E0|nr:efflux RND transporter permease subunit [Halothiobacillus sp.]